MGNKGKVLSDHVHPRNKDQEGYVYIRVPAHWLSESKVGMMKYITRGLDYYGHNAAELWYTDKNDDERVISSQRVEDAVEIADFLARCKQRGWNVTYLSAEGYWFVSTAAYSEACAKTLREAYFRAVAYDKDLQQAQQDRELLAHVAEF